MRQLINEYGLIAVAVLCTLSFMALWNYITYGSNSFTVIYKTDSIYQNDLLKNDINSSTFKVNSDSINAVTNIRDEVNKPYFNLLNESTDIYVIDATESEIQEYTYNECLDLFSKNILKVSLFNGSKYNSYDLTDPVVRDKVEIVIIEMKPRAYTSSTSGDTVYITSLQDIYDKYGNRVLDSNGNPIQSEQIIYDEKVFARSTNADVNLLVSKFYINNDVPCKYKVIYRVTDKTLKAEYTAVFVNKIRETENVETDVYKKWFPEVNFGVDN